MSQQRLRPRDTHSRLEGGGSSRQTFRGSSTVCACGKKGKPGWWRPPGRLLPSPCFFSLSAAAYSLIVKKQPTTTTAAPSWGGTSPAAAPSLIARSPSPVCPRGTAAQQRSGKRMMMDDCPPFPGEARFSQPHRLVLISSRCWNLLKCWTAPSVSQDVKRKTWQTSGCTNTATLPGTLVVDWLASSGLGAVANQTHQSLVRASSLRSPASPCLPIDFALGLAWRFPFVSFFGRRGGGRRGAFDSGKADQGYLASEQAGGFSGQANIPGSRQPPLAAEIPLPPSPPKKEKGGGGWGGGEGGNHDDITGSLSG